MSDKATIDALGYWVSRLSARVKALEEAATMIEVPLGPLAQPYPSECCGRGPACGACDPEPVPEWRRLVDKAATEPLHGTALGAVLYHLSHVANPQFHNVAEELAKIIAVCEAQVGDGWQADPDASMGGYPSTAWGLIEALADDAEDAGPDEGDWVTLAGDAARWLRDLLAEPKQVPPQ